MSHFTVGTSGNATNSPVYDGGGLEVAVNTDGITILQEGRSKKFLQQVEQITFSGAYAKQEGQTVLYITERAVLELTPEGIELREIAPGVDL